MDSFSRTAKPSDSNKTGIGPENARSLLAMKNTNKFSLLLLPLFALLTFGLMSCEEKGPAEKAGEKVDEAVEEVEDELDDATTD